MSDDLREWLKTIPVVTDADKAELREAITKLAAQQRGTRNAETILCEMLEVDDGSQILDAIQGLKERINRLEMAGNEMAGYLGDGYYVVQIWIKAVEAKP